MKSLLTTLLLTVASVFTATAQAQVAQPGRAGWQADTRANCKVWNPIPQAGETVEWSGICTNGYADGGGQLTWKFATGSEVWTVNMAAGKSGTGPYKIVTTHNGTTSTWTGTFTNGIKTGVNVRTFTDGSEFEGSWTNGQANGPSVYTTKDGARQNVYAINGCIWSAETGGTFINSVDKNKNQCLSERGTSTVVANTSSAITECHTLASSPSDPQRKAQGVPYAQINAAKAVAACRLATQQAHGDGQLWFEYGRALERGNLLPDAINAYQTGVNLNNVGAMNNLGELYLDGKGLQKNLATAESLFRRAADLGFPEAKEHLAKLGVSVNSPSLPARGTAVNGNDVHTQTYEEGLVAYENKDYTTALAKFKLAAAQGSAKAQNGLGRMYQNGEGVTKDYVEAAKWFKLAAAQGHASAQTFLDQIEKASNEMRGAQQSASKSTLSQVARPDFIIPNLHVADEIDFIASMSPLIRTIAKSNFSGFTREEAERYEQLIFSQAAVLKKYTQANNWECEITHVSHLYIRCAALFTTKETDKGNEIKPKLEFLLPDGIDKSKFYIKDRISFSGSIDLRNNVGHAGVWCKHMVCADLPSRGVASTTIGTESAEFSISGVTNVRLIK